MGLNHKLMSYTNLNIIDRIFKDGWFCAYVKISLEMVNYGLIVDLIGGIHRDRYQ